MPSRNVETLRSAHESWNRRDFNAAVKAMTESATYTDHARNQTFNSPSQFKEWLTSWAKAFSDGQIANARYIDAGDTVIAEFTADGTNDGPFGAFPPSGRRASVHFCEICRFDAQGRIVSGGAYYDQLSFLMQLGHTEKRAAAR